MHVVYGCKIRNVTSYNFILENFDNVAVAAGKHQKSKLFLLISFDEFFISSKLDNIECFFKFWNWVPQT